MEHLPLSVSDAVALVNQTLEYAFPTLVVEGEVSSFKVNQGKFVFFDIKDSDSSLGCFMMVYQLRVPLEDGMRVQVVATPKLTNWGKFSLTVREIRPVGEGALRRAYELLRARLETEGLFAVERKRRLPDMPKNIAVISSTQAAGYADFVRILGERWGGLNVQVAHVQVQGASAADQIVRAIKYFNEQSDLPEVIAIVRGGGSADDLAVFNDELLVREIAASRIPTIVGVGHETDDSLADMVADVRAATPSHAAQILTPDRRETVDRATRLLEQALSGLQQAIHGQIAIVDQCLRSAIGQTQRQLDQAAEQAESQLRTVRAYDPAAVLARGYALVRGQVAAGNAIEIERSQDIIKAEVTHVVQK